MALWLTLGTGLFMMVGMVVVFLTQNNQKVIDFSISIAFGVMGMLIFLELLPEAYEKMNENFSILQSIFFIFGFVLLGVFLLKVLDLFIPDHDADQEETTVLENLFHIGIVSSVALILHNIIEGMAIYSTVTTDSSLGFLVMIGVGLHNIPMGMVLTSTLYQANHSKKKTGFYLSFIALSTLFGGIIMHFLSSMITSLVLAILLSITLGMLIYIVIFELLKEIHHNQQPKITILGILMGIVIFLITCFFE